MGPSKVEFTIHSLSGSLVFKTHDTISGNVLFRPHEETNVEDISIELVGITRTEVENMNTHTAFSVGQLRRKFLSMISPIHGTFGETETLMPGKTYRFHFNFVVPEQLPVQTCSHQCSNLHIQQQHLQLPASLDHQDQKSTRLGEMSPDMVNVLYSINFAESVHPVQIMPTREEHAPILVPTKSMYYRLRSEKKVSRGMMKRSLGKLVACSTQPPAIRIQSPQERSGEAPTTLLIHVQFRPLREGELPPSLQAAQFQLRAMTFFGLEPWQDYPDLSDVSTWSRHGFWSDCVSLTPENDVEVEWKATKEHGHTVYVALLEPRLSLPSHRSYPPTFHSCLVSRAYALKATLVYRAHGRKRGSSRLSISVPLEICAT
ncbi:unnamed protein product [Penicillium salamii]|nr:unnamed protein product [Penicillium salamii]CAG8428709.1 unnamed protein product [Penicillium salamii]